MRGNESHSTHQSIIRQKFCSVVVDGEMAIEKERKKWHRRKRVKFSLKVSLSQVVITAPLYYSFLHAKPSSKLRRFKGALRFLYAD